MDEAKVLVLTEDLFLGKGAHKATYVHPEDISKCVKVPYKLPDTDVDRELEYRAALKKQKKNPSMLTKYYGTVQTDKGYGYIYECIRDFDGNLSLPLLDLFSEHRCEQHLGVSEIELMKQFRKQWMKECIVTSDTDFVNYFAQKISPTDFVVRIVDNVGTPSKFPLAFYFDYFAKKRAQKYWTRLMQRYIDTYCEDKNKAEAAKLL